MRVITLTNVAWAGLLLFVAGGPMEGPIAGAAFKMGLALLAVAGVWVLVVAVNRQPGGDI